MEDVKAPDTRLCRMRRKNSAGDALVETTLMLPWIFFLFVAILDFGFYTYAAIGLQNAANAAALVTGANPGTAGAKATACLYATQELQAMPNAGSFDASCTTGALVVNATATTIGGMPSTQVTVTYRTIPMIPIPGLMMGQLTVTRNVYVPVYGES